MKVFSPTTLEESRLSCWEAVEKAFRPPRKTLAADDGMPRRIFFWARCLNLMELVPMRAAEGESIIFRIIWLFAIWLQLLKIWSVDRGAIAFDEIYENNERLNFGFSSVTHLWVTVWRYVVFVRFEFWSVGADGFSIEFDKIRRWIWLDWRSRIKLR